MQAWIATKRQRVAATVNYFELLPIEIWEIIAIDYLDIYTIIRKFAMLCKKAYIMTEMHRLWKRLIERDKIQIIRSHKHTQWFYVKDLHYPKRNYAMCHLAGVVAVNRNNYNSNRNIYLHLDYERRSHDNAHGNCRRGKRRGYDRRTTPPPRMNYTQPEGTITNQTDVEYNEESTRLLFERNDYYATHVHPLNEIYWKLLEVKAIWNRRKNINLEQRPKGGVDNECKPKVNVFSIAESVHMQLD